MIHTAPRAYRPLEAGHRVLALIVFGPIDALLPSGVLDLTAQSVASGAGINPFRLYPIAGAVIGAITALGLVFLFIGAFAAHNRARHLEPLSLSKKVFGFVGFAFVSWSMVAAILLAAPKTPLAVVDDRDK